MLAQIIMRKLKDHAEGADTTGHLASASALLVLLLVNLAQGL